MKFVNIVPTCLLDKPEYWCSEYHLILANKLGTERVRHGTCVVNENNQYTKKVLGLKKLGGKIILDNGVFETGKSVSLEGLIQQAINLDVYAVVLPDCENYKQLNHDILRARKLINNKGSGVKIMAVLQGDRLLKVYDMFNRLQRHEDVDIIAIPDRLLREKLDISRPRLIARLEALHDFRKPIHLFALDHWRELEYYKEFEQVVTLDSTFPHKCGMAYIGLPDGLKSREEPRRPKDYFEQELNKVQLKMIKGNVAWIKYIMEG